MVTDVVDQAARVSEIGFADFTAQLVRDVFGVLLQTNLEQTKVYMDLVERISTGVAAFIERTKDDVDPQEISAFLAAVSDALKVVAGENLTAADAARLNAAITVPESAGVNDNNAIATAGALTDAGVDAILKAVATRIAFGRFQLLEAMVKQGITRIVIDSGVIESKLTFNTYTRSVSKSRNAQSANAGGGIGGGFGALGKGVVGVAGGAFFLTSSSASASNRDVSGSSVNIFGRVEIRFKTDYVPLD
jgi:hypothetical protein